jgi:hypothetical protein
MGTTMPRQYVDERAAALYLDLSPRTLQEWRRRGGGPPYRVVSSRCIRYDTRDLDSWMDARVRTSTMDEGTHQTDA